MLFRSPEGLGVAMFNRVPVPPSCTVVGPAPTASSQPSWETGRVNVAAVALAAASSEQAERYLNFIFMMFRWWIGVLLSAWS